MPGDHLTPIELSRSRDGDEASIELRGELDPHTTPQLEHEINEVLADGEVRRLVLDLAELAFIDSSGIRSLIRAQQTMAERGGEVVLRSPGPATQRLLEITHLDVQFEVDES